MTFYITLTVSTSIIVILTFLIWAKTRNVAFPLGIAAFYYWSLYGAWFVTIDKTGGESGGHYQYLETKLFSVNLDDEYLLTLLLYAVFIILIEIAILLFSRKWTLRDKRPLRTVTINHGRLLFIGFTAGILSLLIVWDALFYSFQSGISSYTVTRTPGEIGDLFTLHQTLNRLALFSLAIGLATYFSGENGCFLTAKRSKTILFLYILLAVGLYAFCLILGNKNELFTSLILFLLLYLNNSMNPKKGRLAIVGSILFFSLGIVDLVRSLPLSGIYDISIADLFDAAKRLGSSNEAFGAHFSLYGVLLNGIPPTYGSSLISLAASIVPRILWPTRPDDIYAYYSESVGAVPGQGYALHHATGWYLNFGLIGIVIGSLLVGYIWTRLYDLRNIMWRHRSNLMRVFIIVAPISFTCNIPSLVRSGIEGYKGVAVDAFLLPTIIMFLATLRFR